MNRRLGQAMKNEEKGGTTFETKGEARGAGKWGQPVCWRWGRHPRCGAGQTRSGRRVAGSLEDMSREQTEGSPVQREAGRDTDYVVCSWSGRWRTWDRFQGYSRGNRLALLRKAKKI